MTMSLFAISSSATARPSGVEMSRVISCLPRAMDFHHRGVPYLCGGHSRSASGLPGFSALITCAPKSASSVPTNGPASMEPSSSTVTSESAGARLPASPICISFRFGWWRPFDSDDTIEDHDHDYGNIDCGGRHGRDHRVDVVLDVVEELHRNRHQARRRVEDADLDVDPRDDEGEQAPAMMPALISGSVTKKNVSPSRRGPARPPRANG